MDFDSDGVFKIVLALPAIVSLFIYFILEIKVKKVEKRLEI